MSAVAFDTHAFVKRLTSVGMPEAQAEVLADEQVRLIDERLATKADIAILGGDIAKLEAEMKTDIARLEATTKADIAKLDVELKTDIARPEAGAKRDIREAELRLEAKIDASKSETLKWMIGSMGFQTIVIFGAVFGLVHLFVH